MDIFLKWVTKTFNCIDLSFNGTIGAKLLRFGTPFHLQRIVMPPKSAVQPSAQLFDASKAKRTTSRKKTTYSHNVTCGIAVTPSEDKVLQNARLTVVSKTATVAEQEAAMIEMVSAMQNNIIEHAARRVDFFFYLLVAVYDTKMTVIKAATEREHGAGAKPKWTNACHSSLFPNVLLIKPERHLRSKNIEDVSLHSSALMDTLNSTVELPLAVNGFDGHMEGRGKPTKLVVESESILNKVSQGTIDPKEGMNRFFDVLNTFFAAPHKNYFRVNGKVKKLIEKYQIEGSFLATKKDRRTVADEYIHLMLRLSPKEIKSVEQKPELIKEYYLRIQREINNRSMEQKSSRF